MVYRWVPYRFWWVFVQLPPTPSPSLKGSKPPKIRYKKSGKTGNAVKQVTWIASLNQCLYARKMLSLQEFSGFEFIFSFCCKDWSWRTSRTTSSYADDAVASLIRTHLRWGQIQVSPPMRYQRGRKSIVLHFSSAFDDIWWNDVACFLQDMVIIYSCVFTVVLMDVCWIMYDL